MRLTCLNSIFELAKRDKRVVFVGSDLGFGVLQEMRDTLPDQFYMVGISEQHLIGMAAGLAREGRIPYVNTIATFLTRRCYEQICLDVALPNLPVRLVGNGGGAVYAPLGPTHIATDDIALMRTCGVTVLAPADKAEMAALMPQTLDYPWPMYIRLGWGEPIVTQDAKPIENQWSYFGNGPIGIFTTGNMLGVCLEVKALLDRAGLETQVIHCPILISKIPMAIYHKAVFTVEEGITSNGLASLIGEYHFVDYAFGLPLFPSDYGTRLELLARYGLTAENIAAKVRELI